MAPQTRDVITPCRDVCVVTNPPSDLAHVCQKKTENDDEMRIEPRPSMRAFSAGRCGL